jgi:hypothetical protein
MPYLVRLRVFLLCCLLMIGMNVMLIMSVLLNAGSAAGETGSLSGCATRYASEIPCGYGFCAEKR